MIGLGFVHILTFIENFCRQSHLNFYYFFTTGIPLIQNRYLFIGILLCPLQVQVTESNVVNVAAALNNATKQQGDKDELTLKNVQDIAETFRNIVDVESVTPEVRQYRK